MNVIVFSKRHGRARQIELGRPLGIDGDDRRGARGVSRGVLFAGHAARPQRRARTIPASKSSSGARKLEEQRAQVLATRRELQDRLDALASRVGQMNAHVIRLDALGRRLTDMANLDKGEFDFDSEPAVGGPEGLVEGAIAAAPELTAMLDDLANQIKDRERQLACSRA